MAHQTSSSARHARLAMAASNARSGIIIWRHHHHLLRQHGVTWRSGIIGGSRRGIKTSMAASSGVWRA